MDYGVIQLRIEEMLEARQISKNKICKDLDIPRSNFNRYCQNRFQRIDAVLLCKLCFYFQCNIDEIIKYIPVQNQI